MWEAALDYCKWMTTARALTAHTIKFDLSINVMIFILDKRENKTKQSRLSHTARAHHVQNFPLWWQVIATFAKSSYVFEKDKSTERVAEETVIIDRRINNIKSELLPRAEFSRNKCWMSLEGRKCSCVTAAWCSAPTAAVCLLSWLLLHPAWIRHAPLFGVCVWPVFSQLHSRYSWCERTSQRIAPFPFNILL